MKMGVAGTFFEPHLWNSGNLLLFSRCTNYISITFWIFWLYKICKKCWSLPLQVFRASCLGVRLPNITLTLWFLCPRQRLKQKHSCKFCLKWELQLFLCSKYPLYRLVAFSECSINKCMYIILRFFVNCISRQSVFRKWNKFNVTNSNEYNKWKNIHTLWVHSKFTYCIEYVSLFWKHSGSFTNHVDKIRYLGG